ncbi:MAG: protein-L-isoaspartate O-methyltransferase [Candidatus Micrarchaeota archaeon]|nr:protein-L-isoaspartate O-methyltransferase [Candidatus Micrarchaeota archaeon]
MVEKLRIDGYLHSKMIEDALLAVDRGFFVSAYPYDDRALPLILGQTISAPGVVAFMLERLELEPGMTVLEIGTGSGYNAALLSHILGEKGKVVTFEVLKDLHELAKANLEKIGSPKNIELHLGDCSAGYVKSAPYDRIIVTAAMPYLDDSHPLIGQLNEGGKLIAPVGERYFQNLVLYDKKSKNYKNILPVIFVPMVGDRGFHE